MKAMQYTIQLPDDFNLDKVSERVSERAALFDNLQGLAHKSFLFNNDDHIYAPFYIWSSTDACKNFLLNDLFKGVIDTFNRPRVRSWCMLTKRYGNREITPTYALREADLISADAKLCDVMAREEEKQQKLIEKNRDSIYLHSIALDADRWEIIRYSLWQDKKSAPTAIEADLAQSYDVLHVSDPVS